MVSKNPLTNLFGRSPIGPIQEHMRIANEAAQMLPDLFQAAADEDWVAAKGTHKEIADAEARADKLKRSIRRHLPKGLFMPVPRTDLLSLVSHQDKIANSAKDISGLVTARNMRFPDKMQPGLMELVQNSAATSQQALTAIQELDELLEVGFVGLEVKRVEAMLKELDKLERRTDRLAATLRGILFPMESELPPVDVMFFYRMLLMIGGLADHAESVGDRLQIIMAK
jgi:predicted phosphate transport protein (TIGR00153 family)